MTLIPAEYRESNFLSSRHTGNIRQIWWTMWHEEDLCFLSHQLSTISMTRFLWPSMYTHSVFVIRYWTMSSSFTLLSSSASWSEKMEMPGVTFYAHIITWSYVRTVFVCSNYTYLCGNAYFMARLDFNSLKIEGEKDACTIGRLHFFWRCHLSESMDGNSSSTSNRDRWWRGREGRIR